MVFGDLNFVILDRHGKVAAEVEYDSHDDIMNVHFCSNRASYLLPERGNGDDLEFFLESRMMPKRENYIDDLRAIGLNQWVPIEILKKTKGALVGDEWTIEWR